MKNMHIKYVKIYKGMHKKTTERLLYVLLGVLPIVNEKLEGESLKLSQAILKIQALKWIVQVTYFKLCHVCHLTDKMDRDTIDASYYIKLIRTTKQLDQLSYL